MRRLLLTCAALALTTTLAAAKDPPDLTGAYTIKTGAMPNKSKYVGKVELTKSAPDTYNVAWATGKDGETKSSGIAMQWGKYVAAAFGGESHFAGMYDPVGCEENGNTNFICGTATNENEKTGGMAAHRFQPDPKTKFVGTFDVEGSDGINTTITAVQIAKVKGTVHRLTWTFSDGHTVSGVGILADKKLYWAAGKGGFGLALYKINGAALDGQWVMNGSGDVGTEKLAK